MALEVKPPARCTGFHGPSDVCGGLLLLLVVSAIRASTCMTQPAVRNRKLAGRKNTTAGQEGGRVWVIFLVLCGRWMSQAWFLDVGGVDIGHGHARFLLVV